MTDQPPKKKKRTFTRSPSYPAINLENAIGCTQTIKEREGGSGHFIPYTVALGHLGFGPNSSSGIQKLSALKKFGLIEERGKGKAKEIKLSDIAIKVLFFNETQEDSPEYQFALKEAALMPQIHRELWDKYEGNLPSDQTIKTYLVIYREDGKFSENAVDDFIRQFRSTISFAKLTKYDTMSGYVEDKKPLHMEGKMNTMPKVQIRDFPPMQDSTGASQTFNIPIIFPSGKAGSMQIPYPLTKQEWEQLIAFLNVYKPSLMKEELFEAENNEETER